ncbi:MAG TPA: DUF2933 domain-containing protein [Candidatus Handelsmanbacteria bacterium]|nr:DUF2933 domain-containing protein [Candidatus Handelsmanbacteria bacterium]
MGKPALKSREGSPPGGFWTSKAFLVCLGFLAVAIVLLWSEHRAHILGAAFWLLLLACPLLHVFMHHGHSGNGSHQRPERGENSPEGDGHE